MPLSVATPKDLLDHVGDQLGPTAPVTVEQDRINLFADATGDHQWIHIDVERANAESPFGGPIAHGYLTLSLANLFLPQLLTVETFSMGVNVGVEIGEGIQVVVRITITVDGAAKPSCVVDTVSRFFP